MTTNDPASASPVAMITGGSSGIGLATAKLLATQGYRIAICGRREEKLQQAVAEIKAATTEAGAADLQPLAIAIDMSDIAQASSFAERTLDHFGRVDVLVNNAAVAPLAPFADVTPKQFESTINVNLRGVFYLTQAVWKHFLATAATEKPATIVNISSQSAVDPFPGFALYGAAKSWLDLLTQALAVEGQDANIRVCSIRPGAVETPLLRGLFPDFPQEQCVSPEDVAAVAWGCINNPQDYPSGQAFDVTA